MFVFASRLGEFYAVAATFGFAYGGVMPLYAVLAREYFGQRILGAVFGAAAMVSSLGMALGSGSSAAGSSTPSAAYTVDLHLLVRDRNRRRGDRARVSPCREDPVQPEGDARMKQKITPFLWFDGQAEQAAKFYVSVFKDGKLGKPMLGPDGKVLVMSFKIQGQEFDALNGGPQFKFNESVSFTIHCKDQKEVDYYWDKLTAGGGEESMCGWLKDKYGLSWQVVPDVLLELMRGPKMAKVMEAFMKMRKFDIAALKRAAA